MRSNLPLHQLPFLLTLYHLICGSGFPLAGHSIAVRSPRTTELFSMRPTEDIVGGISTVRVTLARLSPALLVARQVYTASSASC